MNQAEELLRHASAADRRTFLQALALCVDREPEDGLRWIERLLHPSRFAIRWSNEELEQFAVMISVAAQSASDLRSAARIFFRWPAGSSGPSARVISDLLTLSFSRERTGRLLEFVIGYLREPSAKDAPAILEALTTCLRDGAADEKARLRIVDVLEEAALSKRQSTSLKALSCLRELLLSVSVGSSSTQLSAVESSRIVRILSLVLRQPGSETNRFLAFVSLAETACNAKSGAAVEAIESLRGANVGLALRIQWAISNSAADPWDVLNEKKTRQGVEHRIAVIAEEFLESVGDDSALIERLEACATHVQEAGLQPTIQALTLALARRDAGRMARIGRAICEHSGLARTSQALGSLAEVCCRKDPRVFLEWFTAAYKNGNIVAARALAQSLAFSAFDGWTVNARVEVFRTILSCPDVWVRKHTIRGLRHLAAVDMKAAQRRLIEIDLLGSAEILDAASAGLIDLQRKVPLHDQDLAKFIRKLEPIRRLSGSSVQQVIQLAVKHCPEVVVELFIKRMNRALEPEFDPLPRSLVPTLQTMLRLKENKRLLTTIRECADAESRPERKRIWTALVKASAGQNPSQK